MSLSSTASQRIDRLAAVMEANNIGAVLCSSSVTMGYLAGLHEEGGERLLVLAVGKSGKSRLIAPALAETQAKKSGLEDIRTWRDGQDPYRLIRELADDWHLGQSVVAVDDEMRSSILLELQTTLPTIQFRAAQPVLSALMRIKGPDEIALLKRAGAVADDALDPTLAQLRPGMTEWQVHELLTESMRSAGSQPNFCIVATGAHGAEPHHGTSQTVIEKGDVLVMDYGCSIDGYMSDITRTVVLGAPSPEQCSVYDTVYRAHMAAREAIRPGVLAEEIDKAARRVIVEAGYGDFFIHRTGHGLGLRIHEEPYICAGNQHRLEPGNVFSIEPGIYLPGRFGVRIENIVAVTEDGHESMNAEPSSTLRSVAF